MTEFVAISAPQRLAKGARALAVAVGAGAMLALGGCAAPGFKANVARFQQMPAATGQTFTVVATDPAKAGGLEFQQYANRVTEKLAAYGYRPAAAGQAADLTVKLNYGVDSGKDRLIRDPMYDPFYDPFYGPFGYYGRGYYGRGYYGRAFVFGFHDPFLWGSGFGGYGATRVITVFTSGVDMKIERTGTGERLFEGTAEALSRDNNMQHLVPNLIDAMFTGFPGNSGEKVRITVAPPAKK